MIEILRYEPSNKNKVIGYVDVKIVNPKFSIIIRHIAHLQNENRSWFNLPSFPVTQDDGTNKFFRYFQYETEAHNSEFLKEVDSKLKEYFNKVNEEVCPF